MENGKYEGSPQHQPQQYLPGTWELGVVAIVVGWNKYRYDRIHDSTMSLIIVPVFVQGRKHSNLLQLLSTHFSNPTKSEIAALAEHTGRYMLVFTVHLIYIYLI